MKRIVVMLAILNLVVLGSIVQAKQMFGFSKVNYSLKATLDWKEKTQKGEMLLNFVNDGNSRSEIYFYNYQNEKCPANSCNPLPSGVHGYLLVEKAWVNGDSVEFDQDSNFIVLKLKKEIEPEQMATIHISFFTQYGEGTVCDYMSCLEKNTVFNHLWYPRLANMDLENYDTTFMENLYRLAEDYTVEINLPQELVVAATGEQEQVVLNPDGTKTEVWQAKNVFDFCWGAGQYEINERNEEGVRIAYYHFSDENKKDTEMILNEISKSLALFSRTFGKHPYSTLRILEGPILGAGAFPGILMLQSSQGLGSFLLGESSIDLPHEISHQWWGVSMPADLQNLSWFIEGLASFSQNMYYRQTGYTSRKNNDLIGISIDQIWSYVYSVESYLGMYQNNPVTFEYVKAPAIFEMLSYYLGEEAFAKVLHIFYERYKFGYPTLDDFIQVSREVSGQDLHWFFAQWINNAKLDYGVGSYSSKKIEGLNGHSFENQVVVNRLGDATMPVEVEMVLNDGEKVIKKLGGKEKIETLTFTTSKKIKSVTLDPDHRILDINRYDNRKPIGLKVDVLNIYKFTFSNDEFYHLLLLPSFSRSEDHGWEYGFGLRGKGGIYQGSKILGDGIASHLLKSTLTYIPSRQALNASLDYSTPVVRRKDQAIVGGFHLFNKNGERGGELYMKRVNYDNSQKFWGIWKFSFSSREYYTLSYLKQEIWQKGKNTTLSINYIYNDFNRTESILPGLVANLKADWSLKTSKTDNSYQRVTAHAEIRRKIFLCWTTAGFINGKTLFQERYDLATHGNFKGLPLHQMTGKKLLAGGLEARIYTPILLGIFPYFTVGNLPEEKRTYLEGGIGVGIGLMKVEPSLELRMDFPFWENKPLPDQKMWDWKRFQIRLGIPFSDQWFQKRWN